jgi:IclR family transcriptional regulator, pca regulon regulatory protein
LAEPDPRYFTEAIERALRVLEVLSRERRGLKIAGIAAEAGIDTTTALRVTYTLEYLGYLQRSPDTKRYTLGGKVLCQGLAALSFSDVVERAQPFVADLHERTGETTDLAILDGTGAMVVALFKTPSIHNAFYSLGMRIPLHCSAVGKVLLSECSPDQVRELLGEGPYWRPTRNTKTTLDELMAELERTRRERYAIADQEVDEDLRGIAAPVRNANGEIAAAVSVTVSAQTSLDELVSRMAPLVVSAAVHISQALGAPRWPAAKFPSGNPLGGR